MKFKSYLQICAIVMNLFAFVVKANESFSTAQNVTETVVENVNEEAREKDKVKSSEKDVSLSTQLSRQSLSFWPTIEKDEDLLLLEQVLEDIEKGRGKSQRYKKFTKFMYPLFMGVLIAKIILIPLILKMLTAISSTALVLGKISLITTGFLALKWIFSSNIYDTKDRFEIIYLPNGKPYRSASGSFSLWDDPAWSDSNDHYMATAAATTVGQQKYIPVNLKHEMPYNSYRNVGVNSVGNSIKDLYYYAQHNHNNNKHNNNNYNNNDGNPFL